MIRDLVNHLPLMVTPAWVRSRSTPIALADLLACLREVAELPEASGRILDAGGPEVVTYEEIMCCYGRLVGRRPRILAVPVLTPRLSSYWLSLVTDVDVTTGRNLIESMGTEVLVTDTSIREIVPGEPLDYEEAVRRALEEDGREF